MTTSDLVTVHCWFGPFSVFMCGFSVLLKSTFCLFFYSSSSFNHILILLTFSINMSHAKNIQCTIKKAMDREDKTLVL